jgi:hypothetical protein
MRSTAISERGIQWARTHAYAAKTTSEAFLLLFIASHFDENGDAYLTLGELCDAAKLSPRGVKRALQSGGLVEILDVDFVTGTFNVTNQFQAALHWPRQLTDNDRRFLATFPGNKNSGVSQ